VHVPLRAENQFQLDPDDLERALTPRTKMMIVNSPHNPTGAVLTPTQLKAIAQIAIAHDLLVLSDEIYEKIIYEGIQPLSLASLPGMAARTITVNGFSKTYSMTGWRIGYAVAPRALTDAMIRVHQYTATSATSFAQFGALAACRGSQECVRAMVDEFDRRRQFLLGALARHAGLACVKPQGAFYAFPSIQHLGVPAETLALYLLRHAGVAVVPGSAFGDLGEGYLRLVYANSYENLVEAVERIARALREIPPNLKAGGTG
jgi:aspartate/methionine/tyrosine aminotransferase